MKHYSGRSIEYLWQQVCSHHLQHSEQVMDLDISKAGPCCLAISEPWRRVPSRATNPFIPFWLSILSMTAQDQLQEVVKKYLPEMTNFRDQSNRFSLAMGARLREFAGFDQHKLVHENLRLGMQVVPITLFNAQEDHALQHRPSTLSVIYSMYGGKVETLVTIDSLLLHPVPFHSELSVISMWQEMLCAYLGKRMGPMNVVCGATAAMQADHDTFQDLVDGNAAPDHQSLPIMGDESDPEVLTSDFNAWPLVGVGRGYKSDFFKHTVIPMAMTTKALHQDGVDTFKKKQDACEAAKRINDIGWRGHVTNWINTYFVE